MATTLYLVVVGSGTNETVSRYMYATSTPVDEIRPVESAGKTASVWQITTDNEEHARYLADYQMGRLNSGLFGCAILDSLSDARSNFNLAVAMIAG